MGSPSSQSISASVFGVNALSPASELGSVPRMLQSCRAALRPAHPGIRPIARDQRVEYLLEVIEDRLPVLLSPDTQAD